MTKTIYRGAEIEGTVLSELSDNYYTKCKTALLLDDGVWYRASMCLRGSTHTWTLDPLGAEAYPDLYKHYGPERYGK